jgi:hypothetical protein
MTFHARTRFDLALGVGAGAGAGLLALTACAKMEPPPGAPPDPVPPQVVAIRPESLLVAPDFDDNAEFVFDEVISEGSSPNQGLGTGDLERLILLSPSDEVPKVSWKRNRITVKPREGWQPNRIYRIELRPGVVDLRRNRSDTTVVITLSTGAPAPEHRLEGRVLDWTRGQPAVGALVQAELLPDRLAYRVATDSNGAFSLAPIPDGAYVVRGVLDQNRDMRQDPRELYDTVRVAAGEIAVGEVWAFPHDTVGPRIESIAVRDSMSATITFSQFLDPAQRFDSTAIRVLVIPDSTRLGIRSLIPPTVDDSLAQAAAALDSVQATPPDSVQAAPLDSAQVEDTVAAAPPTPLPRPEPPATRPRESRLPLYQQLVLRVATPWVPGGAYAIQVFGVRNVNGVAADGTVGLQVPETPPPPPPPPPTPSPADSLNPPTEVPGDSLVPVRPDSSGS